MQDEMVRRIFRRGFDAVYHAIPRCTRKMLHIHLTVRTYFFLQFKAVQMFYFCCIKLDLFFIAPAFLLPLFSCVFPMLLLSTFLFIYMFSVALLLTVSFFLPLLLMLVLLGSFSKISICFFISFLHSILCYCLCCCCFYG